MKLKCTTKKQSFKNLTVNTDYDGIQEGENYVVTNDAGIRATYAAKYFRVIPETINLTDDGVVIVTGTRDGSNINLIIRIGDTILRLSLVVASTNISCGIHQVSNISGLRDAIEDGYNDKPTNVIGSEEDFTRLVLEKIFRYLKSQYSTLFFIMSDVCDEDGSIFETVLTEMSVISAVGINPNSNNDICLWTINTNDIE